MRHKGPMAHEFALLPVFRELRVAGAQDHLDALAGAVSERLAAPWSRDQETEATGRGDWRVFSRLATVDLSSGSFSCQGRTTCTCRTSFRPIALS